MIFFVQMSVIQLKIIVARFTGYVSDSLKKYVNYITYFPNGITII